jgi:hypothetical protein
VRRLKIEACISRLLLSSRSSIRSDFAGNLAGGFEHALVQDAWGPIFHRDGPVFVANLITNLDGQIEAPAIRGR